VTVEFARRTVAADVAFEGRGLHSGVPVRVVVKPGEQGVAFNLDRQRTPATVDAVTDTSRCTRLGPVSTVEHLLAALAGLGLTEAEIELDSPELPALDGAAAAFVEGLLAAGSVEVGTGRVSLFERVFWVEDPIRIAIAPGDGLWRFDFETGDRWPGSQSFEVQLTPESFATEVAAARTFAFDEEVGPLRAAGLAQGLDLDSALVLGREGYVNPARWSDEPARHKLLDLIGDLALSRVPPQALNVVAVRSGHRSNVEAARRLAAHARF
jgi:UDP-3-O-[3-hydroxymyristoyl] N-acetylglucosamine deacetylase